MRIAANTFSNSLVTQLEQLNTRQARLQNQAVTGQRVEWADDDPAAMQRALELRADTKTQDQYGKNISFLEERANASLSVMRDLQRIGNRAGEIATLADGTKAPAQLRAYADEISQLIRQGVEFMNQQHRGDYLFGGTRTDQPPFVLTDGADGAVGGVAYQGNTQVPEVEIAVGSKLAVTTPGANTTGAGARGFITDSRNGADFFNHLIALQDHLRAGDTAAIAAADRSNLAKDEDNMVFQLAGNAALQARLEAAGTTASNRSLDLRKQVSQETDADLAQTLVRLNETQTAYRAALQSGASLLRESLMDYLR